MNKKSLLAAALSLAFAGAAQATVITPVNMDPAGSGLNDPTAAAPVGGNPGTTVGEQRRLAYQLAADLWESILVSDVEIRVEASFATDMTCTANSATLGCTSSPPQRIWPTCTPCCCGTISSAMRG